MLESPRSTAQVEAAVQAAAAAWTGAAIPSGLRSKRVTGATVRFRGRSFTLRLQRARRVLAPLICRGSIRPRASGCIVDATIRPSRKWLLLPSAGSLLLAVSWLIDAAPPGSTIGYALLVGVLWALNVGLAAVPVGSDPVAEQAVYVALLQRATAGDGQA